MLAEIIYNFILETVTGSTLEGANNLAILLTFACLIMFVFACFKLVVWVFKTVAGAAYSIGKWRD